MLVNIHISILGRVLQRAKQDDNISVDNDMIIQELAKKVAICSKSDHIQEVLLNSYELYALQDYL